MISTPAEHVRVILVAARERGWPFDLAWQQALSSLPRPRTRVARGEMREWLSALTWSKPFYAAAYAGETLGGILPALEDSPASAASFAAAA